MSTQFDQLVQPTPKQLDHLLELLRDNGAALPLVTTDAVDKNPPVRGIAYDSRAVKAGDIFVSISGTKQDGNAFIEQAVQNGAVCVVSEKAAKCNVPLVVVDNARRAVAQLASALYDRPSDRLRLIGVTGTNGKTTTTHLIEHIFNHSGLKTALIGTLGARLPVFEETEDGKSVFKGKSQYLDVHHTTPQASDLQALLHTMASQGASHVAMEVSSHALSLDRVYDCRFTTAALTNITQDHLDFHKTMDNYWRAKQILFNMLDGEAAASAVINLDDPLAQRFIEALPAGVELYTYGLSDNARIYPRRYHFDSKGMELTLATPGGDISFSTRLTGEFNLYNIMTAMAVAIAEGLTPAQVALALKDFAGVSGRFEVVSGKRDKGADGEDLPLCIVDYAHTPDGLDNVLKAARALVPTGKNLIALFGCGGDRDTSKRPQMGEIAETLADKVVVTSDNPRSEDPEQIIADILAGISRLKDVTVEVDRARAIKLAVEMARSGDVLVVAGKGHETYQILKDRTIDFDDRVEVARALDA